MSFLTDKNSIDTTLNNLGFREIQNNLMAEESPQSFNDMDYELKPISKLFQDGAFVSIAQLRINFIAKDNLAFAEKFDTFGDALNTIYKTVLGVTDVTFVRDLDTPEYVIGTANIMLDGGIQSLC